MTSQDESTRTADRLKDALGAAADVMTASDSPVWGAAADVISSGDSLVRIRGPRIGHAWKWLVPLTAAASVVAIALVAVFAGHPAGNTGGPTITAAFFGPVHLVNVSAPDPAVPDSPGVQAARSRVVKILGSAPECGRSIEGSGFVYAPQHVITAAHDIAGVTRQTVTTADGVTYRARVVFYDPRTDIAVLDVPGLNAAPLRFSTQANPDDNAVVAGYPLDRAFTAVPARIAAVLRAEGTNIYQAGHVDRQLYEIRAAVQPGDSGGPLLSPSGTVDGVLQAVESGVPDTGFALTASQIQADAKAAASATAPVSPQGCTP
jgi:S1-C subfamily serine protease